jgi:hypothetical protein
MQEKIQRNLLKWAYNPFQVTKKKSPWNINVAPDSRSENF